MNMGSNTEYIDKEKLMGMLRELKTMYINIADIDISYFRNGDILYKRDAEFPEGERFLAKVKYDCIKKIESEIKWDWTMRFPDIETFEEDKLFWKNKLDAVIRLVQKETENKELVKKIKEIWRMEKGE